MKGIYDKLFKVIITRLSIANATLFVLFILSNCHDERIIPSYESVAQSVSEHKNGTLLGGGVNGLAESYSVWVSNTPTGPFVSLGEATGTGFFELAGNGLSSARYVKIQDEIGGSRGAVL